MATRKAGTQATKVTPERQAVPPKPAAAELSDDDVRKQIARLAYRIAEQRGFAPGHEEEDWLTAEARVKADLGLTGKPN